MGVRGSGETLIELLRDELGLSATEAQLRSPAGVTDDTRLTLFLYAANEDQAARNLRQKESRREEQFRKSVEAERDRGKLLERRFEEALEKAKEEPPGPPPPRDIDLD